MRRWLPAFLFVPPLLLWCFAPAPTDEIERHRNLGKAFYENPTTQKEAVAEFAKAMALAPDSPRERLNWALSLLRAGNTAEAISELEKVQKQAPSLPHTWFNLAIAFKKAGEIEKAIAQMKGFVRLIPDEPISQYNLGSLYKSAGDPSRATQFFERVTQLDATLAAPHFQLYNLYRTSGRAEDAKRELSIFQALRKQQEGAAIPEDVEWNAWAEVLDVMQDHAPALPVDTVAVYQSIPLPGKAAGGLFLDVLNDGHLKALTWTAAAIALEGVGTVASLPGITGVVPGDFNNDGLPDLCVLTSTGPVLLANRGAGRFARFAASLPAEPFSAAVWLDYDHDYDLDLFLFGQKSMLFRNAGSAGFQDHTADFPFFNEPVTAAASLRVIADTKAFDLAVAFTGREGVVYRDRLQGKYTAEPLALPGGASQLRVADLDNNGFPDLIWLSGGRAWRMLNREGKFGTAEALTASKTTVVTDAANRGVLMLANPGCPVVDAGDRDGDGLEDLLCVRDAAVSVQKNRTPAQGNSWLRVRLTGVKNLKSASMAEVEVKAGGRYQKRLYTGSPLTFGLGAEKVADTVRITWPNGLIQNEIRQAAGKSYRYEEAQRLSGSCPIVWSWDGKGFRYITDVLGVAPLGASTGDGQYFPTDDEENIQISADALQPRSDGMLEIRVSEELSEAAYLDRFRLIAVDHPAASTTLINEKFQSPPYPPLEITDAADRLAPIRARDGQGRDVLPLILRRDQTYPSAFRRDLNGVAETHALELDFGRLPTTARQMLVLHGWVDWADGSTFLAASQEGRGGLQPPSVQVRDGKGRWVTVLEDMGMPAGKPKTITVDLTGKWRSASREVRIVTNLCVYWDEIWLASDVHRPLRETFVPLQKADLGFRGFSPNKVHPQRLQPEQFSYLGASPVSLWNPTPGLYTRYGDVTPLAAQDDNLLIVMGSGDEVRLLFDPRSLPPLAAGQTRDYVLSVAGWAKDRDANTAFSQTTEPLPFHGMSRYPYGPDEHFPDTPETRAWRRDYQTRPALRLIQPLVTRSRLVDRFLVHP